GVRTVDGSVIGDDGFYRDEPYGQGWGWNELQWIYGAPVSALSFNENAIQLNITADPSALAATTPTGGEAVPPSQTLANWVPNLDYYTLDNTMTVPAPGEVAHPGVERQLGSMLVRTWGTVPAAGLHAELAVED